MSEGKDKLFTNTMEDETFQNLKKSEIKIAAENETSEERRRRILYQILMFGFSFLAFAWLHVSREAWAMAKSAKKQQPFGTETLGYFDTIFLFCYGGALLISGQFGDRFKLRYMVGFGLVLAGVTVNLIGIAALFELHAAVFGIFFGLNGIFQSTGWPNNAALVGNWFKRSMEGFMIGLWSVTNNVGNIVGIQIGEFLIDNAGFHYSKVMMLIGICMILFGLLSLFILVDHPSMKGIAVEDFEISKESLKKSKLLQTLEHIEAANTDEEGDVNLVQSIIIVDYEKKSALSLKHAFLIPGVLPYAISHAFLKLCNYGIMFWLAVYITSTSGMDKKKQDAANIQTTYDCAAIVGSALLGFISDKFGKKSPILTLATLLGGGVSCCICLITKSHWYLLYLLIPLLGLFLSSACNLLSSAASFELGKQELLKSNSKAMATVIGIVDGVGGLGSAIGQLAIGYLLGYLGETDNYPFIFLFFGVLMFLSLIFLMPMAYKDLKLRRKELKEQKEVVRRRSLQKSTTSKKSFIYQ